MSEPEKEMEAPSLTPPEVPMQAAKTCATCLIITDVDRCPKCGIATTRVFVPQEVLMDQLARHVVHEIATLGAKIQALTDEIRTSNEIERDKKRYSELKNKLMATLSKMIKEEGDDGKGK
jgi:hypothetical protein